MLILVVCLSAAAGVGCGDDDNSNSDSMNASEDASTADTKDDTPDAGADSGGGSDAGSDAGIQADVEAQTVIENDTVLTGTEQVEVLWTVSSGSPDYVYAWGDGVAATDHVDVTFPGDTPPDDAINSYGLAVGVIAVFGSEMEDLDGKLTGFDESSILGASDRYAIIYRAESFEAPGEGFSWPNAFPAGKLSCGRGVDAAEGESFDSFEPVDCSEVEVIFTDSENFNFVNWT